MRKPSRWPDWLDDVWAKSPAKGAASRPESLPQHTWYVLNRLTELIRLRPELPQTLGVPRLWNDLFWAAFLHDFGKAANGFQARLRGGKRWPHRHEVLSLAFLDWIAGGLDATDRQWVVAGIVSHHKDASEIEWLYPPPDEEEEDDDEDDQLVALVGELQKPTLRGLWRWLEVCPLGWIEGLGLTGVDIAVPVLLPQEAAVDAFMRQGVQRIHHWLRVYRQFVRRMEGHADRASIVGALTLRGYLINADHSASAHAGPLPRVDFDAQTILSSCQLSTENLFAHQTRASAIDGSALLVAPTGSGKTEAALLWAARQAAAGKGLPRLFYTLPYQASMNAMKLRLGETFGAANVGLQHGRSLLALYRMLLERDYGPEQAARQARWSRNLVKLNYPPVRVLSPYQILKGMYRLKGYEALLSDYHGAAFIFDEIHAYEVGRLAMILKTIEFLAQNFDAHFLVMSATFPSLIRDWLAQALGELPEIVADPALYERFCRHRIVLLPGELLTEEGIERIADDARAGKSVLVVCNLVQRAQEAFCLLRERLVESGIPVELLHGRFNGRDRLAKEQKVREATGLASRDRRPIVLVATQVVEVSLNIDLDTIYTDPAPLEALVQRFGRVNRLRRQPDLAPVHVYRLPDDGQKIYDVELVSRALAILEREDGRPVGESAVGTWLDEIYSGEVAARWRERYGLAAAEFEATCIESLRPFEADYGLEKLFYRAFDSIEVLPESLYDEYEQLREQDPILSRALLVPIRWGRYHALANAGLVYPRDQETPPVVRTGYDSQLGLASE